MLSSLGAYARRQRGGCMLKLIALIIALILLIVVVAIFAFAPQLLPSGVGLRVVPMKVTFRSSLLGQGQVATVENPTQTVLHNVRVIGDTRDASGAKEEFEEQWAAGATREFGWVEGWKLEAGDRITISASGFRARGWTAPGRKK